MTEVDTIPLDLGLWIAVALWCLVIVIWVGSWMHKRWLRASCVIDAAPVPAPCEHPKDRRRMLGWTEVCGVCGQGREVS